MLSIIIPAYKDKDLQKTIDSLLQNAEGEIEVVAVLDGYWPNPPLLFSEEDNKKVKQVHLGSQTGMRNAINMGVAASKGEFIMRTDAHCIFSPGYDVVLTSQLEENWIVYPKRFFLDTDKWEIMDKAPNIYNKLLIDSRPKFSGVDWPSRQKERGDLDIDESMAMQGSCWIMRRSWWDKVIVVLESEGYGTHYQDSHEMVFKTWKAGGKLMVNKIAWHAHKHRDFPRTHNYGGAEADASFKYSLDIWRDYYEKEIRPKWKI